MSDELEAVKERLAEVIKLHKSMTPEELRNHDASSRERIDEIDEELKNETDPYVIDDLDQERNSFVEELSETGPEILANEIAKLQGGA